MYLNSYESADFKVSIDWPGINDRAKIRIEEVGRPDNLASLYRTLAIPIQPTSLCNSHISEIIVKYIWLLYFARIC